MCQSRLMSLVEAAANVVVGYGVAVATRALVFPLFGLHASLAQNLRIGAVFSAVSAESCGAPTSIDGLGLDAEPALTRTFTDLRLRLYCSFSGSAHRAQRTPPRSISRA